MPANHCKPHTEAAKAKMRAAHLGTTAPWKHRPSRTVAGTAMYRCGRCGSFLAKELFHADKRNSLGIKSYCKTCHSHVSITSRNPERARVRAQRNEATRRARKAGAGGVVSAQDWSDLLEVLGRACLKCGATAKITQDHIVPISMGGAHHPTNLQPLCRPCNERKQASIADYRTEGQRAAIAGKWVVEFKRVTP